MKKIIGRLSLIGLLLLFFAAWTTSFAEETKDGQLLYDLNYDKEKSVLSGKSKPNANVFINDLAGSIVADDKGEFEIPIPKGLKVSTVLMLDAVGEESTDVRFDFEKNTVETEASAVKESSSAAESSSNTSSESSTEASSSNAETNESQTAETTTGGDKTADTTTEAESAISSENFTLDEEEPERSLIWLWTLLIVLGVIGLAIGCYFWYKKKVEEEEKEHNKKSNRRKRSSEKKALEKLDNDLEDDLYEILKIETEAKTPNRRHKSGSKELKDVSVDDLISLELEKTSTDSRLNKSKKSSKKRSSKKISTKKRPSKTGESKVSSSKSKKKSQKKKSRK